MTPVRIFVSSVQREFADERVALRDYVRGDPLLRRFFDVFVFEDVPATDRRPDQLYLGEVERCELYAGLFGNDYGFEDDEGLSPTEREFDRATEVGAHRLIFVKGDPAEPRHPKMRALIRRAEAGRVRKRFNTREELLAGLSAALVEYLEAKELIRFGPFDAASCAGATMDDLDVELMTRFVRTARRVRGFPLPEDAPPETLLELLNLRNDGKLTNAAVLLFGKSPQRFLISSGVTCAHFHGRHVVKPIPAHQKFQGNVFALVDQAVDFVLSKIALHVGTRADSVRAPVTYEIPKEVVTEAIVNAVAHLELHSTHLPMTVFAAREGFRACISTGWIPDDGSLALELTSLPGGGSAIFHEAVGSVPGLAGWINPIRDPQDRLYLYTFEISVNEGRPQPVEFNLGEDLRLADATGTERSVCIAEIQGRAALVEYRG